MIKTIGYYVFAFVYYASRLLPVNDKRVLCIMTHDDGEDSNVSLVVRELKKLKGEYSYGMVQERLRNLVRMLIPESLRN